MSKKFRSLAAVLLILVMIVQMIPASIFSAEATSDSSADGNAVSVEEMDFSLKRLLVGTNDSSIFKEDTNVIAEYGDVYLLEFEDEAETKSAYTYYSEAADFVDADVALFVADNDSVGADSTGSANAVSGTQPKNEIRKGYYDVAIIDTGVANGAAESASVIGGDGVDDNGHGTAMLDAVKSVSDAVSVLSIKAFDSHGVGYLSDVYAAVLCAIEQNVGVISMSFAAVMKTNGFALEHVVAMAKEAGIIVVGAAGNDNANVSKYLPGSLTDAYIVGACDENGARLSTSNFGDNVLCNVVAGSTSEAAAKLAAIIALYGVDYVDAEMNNGLIFDKDYGHPAEEHDQLVETEASDSKLLNKSELTDATLDAISGKPVASTNKTDATAEEPADEVEEPASEAEEPADAAEEPVDEVEEPADADEDPTDVAEESVEADEESADDAEEPANMAEEPADAVEETADEAEEIAAIADEPDDTTDEPVATADEPAVIDDTDQDPDWSTPPSQDPETADNTTIERVYVRWLSTSAGEETPAYFGTLNLVPDSELVADQQFQIDFALSGQEPYEPGMIELTFPAYLWKDRNDKEPGYFTLAVPEDPTEGAEFVWKRIDDNIVITNAKTLPAASKVMIQGTFRGVVAPDMKDETTSLDFDVTLTVETPFHNTITKKSNSINATIDTSVNATYANKTAYNSASRVYDIWWEEIPDSIPNELLPQNPNNYAYIRWYVSGTAYGSQPFDMYVTDTVSDDYGGIMLGVSHCAQGTNGTVKSADNKTVTALLYHGYSTTAKTAYVWTAYPKDRFPADEVVMIPNEQTISVVGWDDEIKTTQSAEASVDTKSPTTYTFIKHWDDLNDKWEVRPKKLDLIIIYEGREWDTITLTEEDASDGGDNDWKYTWSDGGLSGTFDVLETMYDYYGVWDTRFDGTGHKLEWNYILVGTDYDPETHTWTYTNRYDEGWIKFEISTIDKSVENKFNDSSTASTRDGLSLNKLLKNEDIIVKYPVTSHISVAKPSVWFGVKPNRFVLEDVEYILNDNTNLTVNDVSINAVTLQNPVVWHYIENSYNEEGWYQRETVKAPEATLYGLMGENNWVRMATLLDGKVTPVGEGVTVSDMRVKLPDGVSRVKLELESDEAVVEMNYTVELRVRPTESVLAMINSAFEDSDHLRFTLYNKANAYAIYLGNEEKTVDWITYKNGDRVSDMSDIAIGYLHGRQFKVAADLEKTFELTENDETNKRVKLSSELTLTQQSNVNTISEYKEAIADGEIPNTNSGVFYDLLPLGVDPDLKTIKAKGNDRIVNSWVVENYKDSGRTLLVVKVEFEDNISNTLWSKYPDKSTYPVNGYKNQHTITFDSYCPWGVIMNTSTGLAEMRNVAAYEADETEIGTYTEWSGEPDDPTQNQHVLSSTAVGPDAELMTDLDPKRNDPSFVYAGAPLVYGSIDVQAITGLEKSVQAAGSGYWSKGLNNDVNVQEGGKYSYRLYVRSASDTITQNIILLDSIENYMPQDTDDPDDIADTHWHGTLESVDLAQVKAAGVKPVVYYSTVKNIDVSEYAMTVEGTPDDVIEKLASSPDWSTEVEDISKVTAVAIDLRHREDGSVFNLLSGEALTVYLHMRAPFEKENPNPDYFKNTDGHDHLQNAHAYNDIYLNCLQVVHGENTHAYIHNSYTKVGIYTKYIDVQKLWDDDNDRDGKRPGSIKVHLYADGVDTNESVTLNDNNNWSGTFERMLTYNEEDGSYIDYTFVEEFEGDDEYKLKTKQEIQEDGSILVSLINVHDPETINIPIKKLWDDENNRNNTRPASITVRLYADGKLYKTIAITPDMDGDWYAEFKDLPKYRDHGELIQYTIEEVYVDNYIPGETEGNMDEGFTLNNIYYPFGDLYVKKVLKDETPESADTEFTFTLLLTTKDENGNDIEETNKYKYTIYGSDGHVIKTDEIGNGDEFVLKGGQTLHIEDIPAHVKYAVSEASTNGFEIISVGETGEIISWKPAEAVFTNKYTTKGNAQMEVQKFLYGRELANRQFRFELYDEDGNLLRTAYNDQDGKAIFGQIGYTNEDNDQTFTYKIYEYDAERPGYTYDSAIYTVTVTPHDNGDGTMTCEIKYYDAEGNELDITEGDNNYKIPVFRNYYKAEGSISFRAWKVLEGRDIVEEEFTFDIYDENFKYLGSATNNENGIINFDKLDFTEANVGQTYWYYVREQAGEDETVVYTDAILGYVVTVVDNGDGTLSFDQSSYDMTEAFSLCEDCKGTGKMRGADCETCNGFGYVLDPEWEEPDRSNVPVFYNGLVDGSLSVSKYIDDGGDPYKEFKFKVKLIGDKIEDGEIEFEISSADPREFPDISGYQTVSTETPVAQASVDNANLDNENTKDENSIATIAGEEREIASTGTEDGIKWTYYVNADNPGTYTLAIEPNPNSNNPGKITFPYSSSSPKWRTNQYQKTTKIECKEKIYLYGPSGYMFSGFQMLTDISDLANFDVSGLTELRYGFQNCYALKDLSGLENWKTSNITDLYYAFYNCKALTSLAALKNWNVSGVSSLSYTFSYCESLTNLSGLENWNKKGNIKSLSNTFSSCGALRNLSALADWDASKITNMERAFAYCSKLDDLSALANWKLNSLKEYKYIFTSCRDLKDISALKNWTKEAAPTLLEGVFSSCSSLTDLSPLKDWNTSLATSMNSLFSGCSSLTDLTPLKDWSLASMNALVSTFSNCTSLEDLSPLASWNIENLTALSSTFSGCSILTDLTPLAKWNTKSVTSLTSTFASCKSLTDLTPLAGWNTESLSTLDSTFSGCSTLEDLTPLAEWNTKSLTSLKSAFTNTAIYDLTPISKWSTDSLTSLQSTFSNCKSLSDLTPLAKWNTSKLTTLASTFSGCANLSDLTALASWNTEMLSSLSSTFQNSGVNDLTPIAGWNTDKLTDMSSTFLGCTKLSDLSALAGWNTSGITKFRSTFSGCTSLIDIDPLENWNMLKVTDFEAMFTNCTNLTDISGLANWFKDAPGANKTLESMFSGCSSLSDITPLADWNTSTVNSYFSKMFRNCTSLIDATPLKNWDTSKVTYMRWMFDGCVNLTVVDFSNWNTSSLYKYSSTDPLEEFFKGCENLSKVTLGPDLFKSTGVNKTFVFPEPPESCTTGRWIKEEEADWPEPTETYTSSQLNNKTGTFVWQYLNDIYTVSFEAEDASGLMVSVKGSATKDCILQDNRFVKLGYTFAGWQDKNDETKKFGLKNGVCTIPANTYEADEEVTLIPVWYKDEPKIADVKEGEFEFTLHGNEKATFKNLPAGTIYQVWEETPNGWVLIKTVDASGVITPNETAAAEFYNLYQPNMTAATVIGAKIFDNLYAYEDGNGEAFTFELLEGDKVLQTVNAQPGGFVQFNPIIYKEEGVHTYTIREKAGTNADIQYDAHEETVIVTVSRDEDGNLVAVVEYDDDGATFENRTIPGRLEISKVGEGMNESTKNPDFMFRVKLYNENGIPVDGETIKWYVIDSGTGEVVNNNTDPIVPDEETSNYASAPSGIVASAAVNENLDNKNTKDENSIATIADGEREIAGNGTAKGSKQGVMWAYYVNEDDPTTYTLAIEPNPDASGYTPGEYTCTFGSSPDWAYYSYQSIYKRVTKIETKGHITLKGAPSYIFSSFEMLNDISDLANWSTTGITDLRYSFQQCKSLKSLHGLENWNVSSVKTMTYVFQNCESLEDISALKNWNPTSLTTMQYMFSYCKMLPSLSGLENWDKNGSISSLNYSFEHCEKLTDISALKDWNVSGATGMSSLFSNCHALSDISVLENWTPYSLTEYNSIFASCRALEDISPLKNWTQGSAPTKLDSTFSGCWSLADLSPISGWNTSSVSTMSSLFSSCTSLFDLSPISGWITSSVTSFSYTFSGCTGLSDLSPIAKWNTGKVQYFSSMFNNCSGIYDISPLSNWNTDSATGMGNMFYGTGITDVSPLKDWNTKKVTSFSAMFQLCSGLTDITPLANWDTSSATSISSMFQNDTNICVADFSNWNTGKITSQYSITNFINFCSNLSKITIGENFFNSSQYLKLSLPTPNKNYTTGMWVREEEADWEYPDAYTSADIVNDKMTGTFVWQYLPIMYTINFDGAGASGSMITRKAASMEDYTIPNNMFLKPGFEFMGWQDKNNPDNYFAFKDGKCVIPEGTYDPGETITLEADWKNLGNPNLVPYYINHYQQNTSLNGYDLADMEVKYAEIGTYVSLETKDYVGFVSPAQQADKLISANNALSVRYNYTRSKYTVHFDGNGADFGSMPDLTMIYGVGAVLGNGFSKTDSAFLGWNTDKDGGGKMYSAVTPVQLSAENGEVITLYAQWATINQSVEPSQGEFVVWCKAGQTIVIPDLPAGTTYEIEEIDVPFGWSVKDEENVTGKIIANTTSQATVTNLYSAKGVGSIIAHKTLVGDTLNAGTFTFELFDQDPENTDPVPEPIQTVVNGDVDTVEKSTDENGETVNNPWYGWASVVFDGLQFTEPGDYTYYIREKAGNDPTIVYDTHVEKVTVRVTDNGDGTLSSEVIYENQEGAPFVNGRQTGQLTVSKILENATGAADQKEFEFQIELKDASGNLLNGIYDVVKSNGKSEKLVVTDGIGSIIRIRGGETFTVTGLPHGAQYTVSELDAQGFEQIDLEGTVGTITGGKESNASFTNVYIATIELQLGAVKNFVGGKIEENMFYFELLSDTGKVLQTVAAGVDGKIQFSAIGYSQADVGKTFTYTIREVIGSLSGVKYDAHTETVEVTVSNDKDGNILLTVNKNAEDIVFTNLAMFDLDISKTVTGTYGNQNKDFRFILTMKNDDYDLSDVRWSKGNNSDILRLDENGQFEFTLRHDETISFRNLPYGTTYTIEEVKSSLNDKAYNTTIRTTVSGKETVVEGSTVTGKMEASISIEYENDCTIVVLPDFGGAGTMLIQLMGIILILVSIGAWIYNRKRLKKTA